MKPEELRYAKTHEWAALGAAGPGIVTVGISAFAVEALTDLVFIELPQVGQQARAGEPLGEIESVKAVSDIYSPVDGEVIEVNAPLADQLETLKEDPFGAGWLCKIRVSNDAQMADLLDYAAYQKQCAEESH